MRQQLGISLSLGACFLASMTAIADERLASRYEELLLFERSDYRTSRAAVRVFDDTLLNQFEQAVEEAEAYPYDFRGVSAYYNVERLEGSGTAAETAGEHEANDRLMRLFSSTLPLLAYAYRTPGPRRGDNPYYRNQDVARLYAFVLEYCYSRGLTESA